MSQEQNNFLDQDGCTAIDFIAQIDPTHILGECSYCTPTFDRKTPDNLRDKIDKLAVTLFDQSGWPKSKPIELVDSMAGNLLQTTTILISLVNAGYQVNISLIDFAFTEDMANDEHIIKFKEIIQAVNTRSKNSQSIQLKGIFSRVESYVATVQGIKPVQHERVSQEELREGIVQGKSRRYLKLDLRSAQEKKKHEAPLLDYEINENKRLIKEFSASVQYKDTLPDLVLTIDDMSEVSPYNLQGAERLYFVVQNSKNDYMYRNEIYNPISALSKQTLFIATQKQGYDRIPKIFVSNHTETIDYTNNHDLTRLIPQRSTEAPIIGAVISKHDNGSLGFFGEFKTNREDNLNNIMKEIPFGP